MADERLFCKILPHGERWNLCSMEIIFTASSFSTVSQPNFANFEITEVKNPRFSELLGRPGVALVSSVRTSSIFTSGSSLEYL